MLAVLTAAGEGGLTRDKLVGLLWPEFSPERARHSLTQALYAARKASGEDDLFIVSESIRLNFSCISSDVVEFRDLVRSEGFQRAVDLYRGPFLDGFYLQSAEFDNWLQLERQRLEDLAVLAYTRVIDEAAEKQDYARAVEQARRLAAIRPTDASIAERLMRLLAAAGDRAAALAHAHTYSTIVRERHGIEPDAAVISAAEEIRTAEPTRRAQDNVVAAVLPIDSAVSDQPLTIAPDPPRRAPHLHRLHHARRPWTIALLALAVVLSGLVLTLLIRTSHQPRAQGLQHKLIVAPFRVTAADPHLQYLAEGMVELLSTRLADDSADRSMDAAAVLRAWRSANVSGTRVVPTDSILAVARELAAQRVIVGSVVGTPEHAILDASLVVAQTGRVVSHAVIEGSTDTLTTLVDALARRLLLKEIAAEDELADRTTLSLTALRAYLRGSAAFAERDYMISLREYQRALQLDSTFALAALKLGLVAARIGEFEQQRIALHRAWQMRADLAERDRAVITALLGPNYPALSTVRQATQAWNRAARLAPDLPESWYGLAAATFNSMLHGFGGEQDAIVASLQRAIRLDSTFVPATMLLAALQARTFRPAAPRIETAGPATLRSFALTAQMSGILPRESLQALDALESHAADANEAMELLVAEHSADILTGQLAAALEVTRRMQRVSPATHAHLRLRVLDALYADADSAVAAAAVTQLRGETTMGVDAPANACVLAQWDLARNNLDGARAMIALMGSVPYSPVIAGVHPRVCGALVQTGVAVAGNNPQARQLVARLDSLDFTSLAAGDAAAYASIAVARSYLMLNDLQGARRAIAGRRVPIYLWPRYNASAASLERHITGAVAEPLRKP